MAKSLLGSFRIGSDVIDAVADSLSRTELSSALFPILPLSASAGTPDETPPPVRQTAVAQEAETEAETGEISDAGALTCERDGLFLVFTIGGTTYRLGGVKPLFVTSLRVNIRASYGKVSYYDSIDLYAARGRTSFAQAVNRAWNAEPYGLSGISC